MSSNVKTAYGTSTAITITLASLASDTNLLAGRSSVLVDNTVNLYLDYLLSGLITEGTSPTVGTFIEIWVAGALTPTPTWGDVLAGTDANKTITSLNVKYGYLKLVEVITVDATTARGYYFGPFSIASLFGGQCPTQWELFVVHNTGVALNATGGNHVIQYTPVFATVG